MRNITLALVLGTTMALSTNSASLSCDHRTVHLIRVPVVTPSDPFWAPD
jgi:hypothetical protein